VKNLVADGMQACAITDHGWMAGVIEFYEECNKAGIKPILGVEAYITESPDGLSNEDKIRDNMHMVLLAKDNEGYVRLMETVSNASLTNFYYKPRISIENLDYLSGHIVATTACLGGITAKQLNFNKDENGVARACTDDEGKAIKMIERMTKIFGDDFYLEVQGWDSADKFQSTYNSWVITTAQKMSIPLVITADAHYLTLKDHELHELIMAMQMSIPIQKYRENSDFLYGPHFYVAGHEEMERRAKKIGAESSFHNTIDIANKCNVTLKLGEYQEPVFPITETDDYEEFKQWKETSYGINARHQDSCGVP